MSRDSKVELAGSEDQGKPNGEARVSGDTAGKPGSAVEAGRRQENESRLGDTRGGNIPKGVGGMESGESVQRQMRLLIEQGSRLLKGDRRVVSTAADDERSFARDVLQCGDGVNAARSPRRGGLVSGIPVQWHAGKLSDPAIESDESGDLATQFPKSLANPLEDRGANSDVLPVEPSEELQRRRSLPMLWRRKLQGRGLLPPDNGQVIDVPLSKISSSGIDNVRVMVKEEEFRGLVASMGSHGLINPVTVTPDLNRSGHYHLICGFRRFRAASELGWPTIRASVRVISSVAEAHVLNLLENVSRSSISTFELAVRCELMVREFQMPVSELAKQLGYASSYVYNLIRLMSDLPKVILADWREAHPLLSIGRLERLTKLPNAEDVWLRMRNQHAREENKRPLSLEEQLEAMDAENDAEHDVSGWTPFKRPTKAMLNQVRDIFMRQQLPTEPDKVRAMLVGVVDYVRGARGDIPHMITPAPRRRRRGGPRPGGQG